MINLNSLYNILLLSVEVNSSALNTSLLCFVFLILFLNKDIKILKVKTSSKFL